MGYFRRVRFFIAPSFFVGFQNPAKIVGHRALQWGAAAIEGVEDPERRLRRGRRLGDVTKRILTV